MVAQVTPNYLNPLFAFLEPEKVDALAKETGFIQRKRKWTASDFLSLLFQVHGNLIDPSLQELSTKLLSKQEIAISRTAVDQKFTGKAVHFLQRLVEELFLIQQQLLLAKHAFATDCPFTSLRVLDATHIHVPNSLKARAKKTRQTSVKIQHEFDVLTGRLTFLRVDLENVNDTVMGAKRVPFLDEQELCLQDLGYFHFQVFERIHEKTTTSSRSFGTTLIWPIKIRFLIIIRMDPSLRVASISALSSFSSARKWRRGKPWNLNKSTLVEMLIFRHGVCCSPKATNRNKNACKSFSDGHQKRGKSPSNWSTI
ncbi:transposase [Planococcus antarcticus DSM 14505]|uniref:Transposase n=1 Tax=Planococcus antarcticus DSM 14505 TaxID=1185653 RepID=A0A1C7DDL0_9BACL|nr:transposase [Planococcus antarcticus]ANU09576.1 hypothetical protein BBH88_04295 [Planococcus antarcticus DSM 14505]EIM08219.1 transposase [Planococcus antarcticus DSM 14505]